jgi:hypothetical protein
MSEELIKAVGTILLLGNFINKERLMAVSDDLF